MSINDPSLEPPERPDFRRRGKGVPVVWNEENGRFEPYRRASSAGKILDDETGLTDWKICTGIYGAAQRPDLMAILSTLDLKAHRNQIRDIAEDCLVAGKGTERRNTGTAIHAMLDHVDLDHEWTPAPQFRDAVDSYIRALEIYGLVPVDVEVKCVNDLHRIAGTMDRRYRTTRNLVAPDGSIIPIGSIVAADTKTGQSLEYAAGSYSTQLAAYADSVRYDVVTNERYPFDPPTYSDWAIIVHVDANDARTDLYYVDLEAGRHGLQLSSHVRDWRSRTDLILPAREPLRTVASTTDEERAVASHPSNGSPLAPTAPVAAPVGPPATTAPLLGADASTGDLDAVRAWLRGRIATVRGAGLEPTGWLQRRWPAGVAGLKYDTQTEAELDAIAEVLDGIETQFSLPFPATDPRLTNPVTGNRFIFDTTYTGPRKSLIREWLAVINYAPHETLMDALTDFATLSEDWRDEDITEMLDGTLRAVGYDDGVKSLGDVTENEANVMRTAAWGLQEGTAYVLYGEDGKPVVRTVTIITKG